MIVSGGENVFPLEVENLIAGREDIFEAAVIGVGPCSGRGST
jgi:fatty-acyl-CoA synthase